MHNTHFKGDLLAQTSSNEVGFATTKGKAQSRREFIVDSAKLGAALALFGGATLFSSKANAANLGANSVPTFTLNNGVLMPAAGFGTLKLGDTAATQKAVEQALEAGYRLIDTAQSYANE